MSLISYTPLTDGSTATAAGVNTPLSTIYNDYNGNITDANIATGAAIAGSKVNYASIVVPYKFSVYRNAAWNVAGGAAKVAFDTKEFDTGTNFDVVTNNRFVAPVTGFYFFSATVNFQLTTADAYYISIYKNGTEVKRGLQIANSITETVGMNVSSLLSLTASDYIEIYTFNGSGVNKTGTAGLSQTYFSGFLTSA